MRRRARPRSTRRPTRSTPSTSTASSTTFPFLAALMQHPRWRKGALSTGFIAEEFPDGFKPREAEGEELRGRRGGRGQRSTIRATCAGARSRTRWRESGALRHARVVKVGDQRGAASRSPATRQARSRSSFRDKAGKPTAGGGRSSKWLPGEPVWNGQGRRPARQRAGPARSLNGLTSPTAASRSRSTSIPSARRRSPR